MAYLGRKGASAALNSADIPDNSITAAKIVDATIAAGDLAPNSVDSSELVDGSIDTSHLSSSLTLTTPNLGTPSAVTLTNATFPAGHIVQVVSSGYLSAGTAGTGTSSISLDKYFYIDGSTPYQKQITITSGNKVLVSVAVAIEVYGTPVGGNIGGAFGLGWNDGSSDESLIASSTSDIMYQRTSATVYNALYLKGYFLQFLHTPDVTNPIYFLEGHSRSTSNSVRVGYGGANFTLMEIQV